MVYRPPRSVASLWLAFGLVGVLAGWGPVGTAATAVTDDAIVPGPLRVDATVEHLGVVWTVSGDRDLDSTMVVEYRKTGTATWLQGAPAVRASPTLRVQDGPLGIDAWGASAMFLEPGTSYDLRVTITDPDGGGETRRTTATTRVWLVADPTGTDRYVVPGDGGGSGTASDPFRGLQTAADAARPGDVFHVAAGVYAPFTITTSGVEGSPITFVGPDRGTATIDGAGTDRGVVTVGRYDRVTRYVIVRGFTIQSGHWGIDAQHTQNIVIADNVIRDVDDGITNRRGNAWESNQTVAGNVITGRVRWPGTGIPPERGIDLRGWGNIVARNRVQFFGDCISVQPSTGPSYGNDVFGNDVAYCVDDGIEIDDNQANVRVWRNRVTNARMGVSVQPIRGGPAYIFRNEFFNLESAPIKMHNFTTGFIVANNTGVMHGNGYGDNGAMWRNAVLRNNLFVGTRYAFEFTTVPDEGFRDLDYDGWGTSRQIGGATAPWFKWDDVRYDRIGDLPPGVEDHGIEVSFGDLRDAGLPGAWNVAAIPGAADLRLAPGSAAIDAGIPLPNLDGPFGVVGSPDLGAVEFGRPRPVYGPPAAADPDAVTVGLVDPATGVWWLRDTAGSIRAFFYGDPGDVPFVGDWDCDGIDTPGLYRRSDGFVYLRNDNDQGVADVRFFFGNPGDLPLAGDFDGDGCDTVSIWRPSEGKVYVIDELGSGATGLGAAETEYSFGNPGDAPFVGDFDGDGIDTVGLHRESTGLVYLRNAHTTGVADASFFFGDPGDLLVAGDWNGDGIDSPGVFRPADTRFYLRYQNAAGVADEVLPWGDPSWRPVAGVFGVP